MIYHSPKIFIQMLFDELYLILQMNQEKQAAIFVYNELHPCKIVRVDS